MSDEERADEEFELPDWLKGVGDDLLPGDDDQPVATSPAEPDSVEGDETPSWLRDLVARAEEPDAPDESVPAEPGDVPDWLQELRPEVPEDIPPDSEEPDWLASISEGRAPDDLQPDAEDEELPSWEQILAEEGIELESVEEAPPPEAEGLTAEEWLRTTADLEGAPLAPEEPEPVAAEPSVEEPEPPAEPVAEAEGDEAGLPDWLREFEVADVAPEAEGPLEEPEPLLLEPLGDVVEDSDVPDWLREIAAGEPVPSAEAEPLPEVEVEEAELPDWLREYEEPVAEEERAEAQPVPPEDIAEPMVTAEEGRALWEQMLAEEGVDLEPVEEVPSPEATDITADAWLRSTADLEEPPLAPQEPEPVAEEPLLGEPEAPPEPIAEAGEVGLPEWLEDTGELPEEEARLAAELLAKSYESDLPDWLRRIAAGEPISAEEGELAEPAAEAEPLEEPTTDRVHELGEPAEIEVEEPAEEVFDVEVDEAGLPDWLREPSTEAVEFPEPEAGLPPEVPEWLTELETEDMLLTESDLEEPAELETGEMPEWLSEIMAGEPALTEEWAVEPAPADAEEEQIPDWLREFREREAEAEAEPAVEAEELEAPAVSEAEFEYEAPPELPEWLLQLRAGVPEPEVPPPTEQPVEAEVEEILPETPIEVEAVPPGELLPELEAIQPEEVGPEWMQELVAAEEAPPEPELLGTRELKALQVEDLPKDPGARLSLARTAFSAGDWSDALMIYQTMVNSSEMLDSVIENLEAGVRRHPDDPAGYQLLGDACMKDGRLGDALNAYRRALSRL